MNDVRELACAEIEARDLMSGYLAGRLSEEDAEAFEKHYFGCEKCWAELKAGTEIRAALAGQSGADATKRRRVWTDWRLLAAAAAVVLAIGGGLLLRRESSGIDALARAAGTRRTSEGRLTGAFEYAPVAPIFRGATSQPEAPLRLRRTALEALEKVRGEGLPPATIHAAGVATSSSRRMGRGRCDPRKGEPGGAKGRRGLERPRGGLSDASDTPRPCGGSPAGTRGGSQGRGSRSPIGTGAVQPCSRARQHRIEGRGARGVEEIPRDGPEVRLG